MKTISAIMKIVNWIVAVFFAVASLLWFSNIIDLRMLSEWINKPNQGVFIHRTLLIIGAFYLILFNLTYLLGRWLTRNYVSRIEVTTKFVSFSIAISAIENSLRHVVRKLPEVHDAHIHVYKVKRPKDKPIRIYIAFSVWEDTIVAELIDKIITAVTTRCNEMIEVKEPPVFTIILSNIIGKEHRKPVGNYQELPW